MFFYKTGIQVLQDELGLFIGMTCTIQMVPEGCFGKFTEFELFSILPQVYGGLVKLLYYFIQEGVSAGTFTGLGKPEPGNKGPNEENDIKVSGVSDTGHAMVLQRSAKLLELHVKGVKRGLRLC